ncbi:anti-sigma factor [uncultured Piscinibacter sp.]|uniref:anti-sigma factor family protein n=1 Tax=uncultured Piscinibacter sp. TaxID=1131835 RepID=UPI002607F882|nr:anti-sigma factor [uncultured Piscinibacter sp.]
MNPSMSDTLLSAWLDDELDGDERARVETWLREHPEDAARVRLWAADRDALRARVDGVLAEPVPQRLQQVVWNRSPARADGPFAGWQRWAAAVAVFTLGGAVGAALVWRVERPVATLAAVPANGQAWVQRAAVAHSVYVPEVRHPVEVKAQEEHLANWLTRRLEMPVKLFDLRAQGFELVGGRLLPDAKGPSAQLMYQAIGEVPPGAQPLRVTIYLRKPEDGTPASFRYEQQGRTGLFYWVEGAGPGRPSCGYAIVGELPRERLLALAQAIERQGTQSPGS